MSDATPRPAGLRVRVFAFALDYVLICAYIIVLALASFLLLSGPLQSYAGQLFATPFSRDLIAFSTLILPVLCYFIACERSATQATWGKHRFGLQVVDSVGRRISIRRAIIRNSAKFAPWQLAHTCLFHIPGWPLTPQTPPVTVLFGFGIVWLLLGASITSILISSRRQALYDYLASTLVVMSAHQQPDSASKRGRTS